MLSLYYESHVTIEPVTETRLAEFKQLCATQHFRVAELLMKKQEGWVPSDIDSFCSSRASDYNVLKTRMFNLVRLLKDRNFAVKRYKIEDVVLDSKILQDPDLPL